MLAEFIAQLRGIDRWPSATATVTTSEVVTTPKSGNWNNIAFYYRPEGGEMQGGTLAADSTTAIYELRPNDTFSIQYDPRNPARYYSKEAQSFSNTFGTIIRPVVLLFFVLLIVSEVVEVLKHHK